MSRPEKAMKISAEGYRQIVRKHRSTLKVMDARITDEGKLVFAGRDFLVRLRIDLQDYAKYDETLNARTDMPEDVQPGSGGWDDEKVLAEPDPYIAILHVVNAIIEFHIDPEKQPGIMQYKKRFGIGM